MILKKFQMLDAKPASIPIPHGVKLIKLDKQEESTIDGKIYQSKVGSLMYTMLCTRPDSHTRYLKSRNSTTIPWRNMSPPRTVFSNTSVEPAILELRLMERWDWR